MQLVEHKQTTNPTQRATRHAPRATVVLQPLLISIRKRRLRTLHVGNDGPQSRSWQNIMAMAATLTIGPTFAPHGHTKLAMLSTEEHFVTCFWAGMYAWKSTYPIKLQNLTAHLTRPLTSSTIVRSKMSRLY